MKDRRLTKNQKTEKEKKMQAIDKGGVRKYQIVKVNEKKRYGDRRREISRSAAIGCSEKKNVRKEKERKEKVTKKTSGLGSPPFQTSP